MQAKSPSHSEAVNFLVAEVARLQNSPRKLNSGEFSYQFFHSLSVTWRLCGFATLVGRNLNGVTSRENRAAPFHRAV